MATDGTVMPSSVDVTSDEGRAALASEVTSRWGALDIFVNNVGAGLRKPFVDYDLLGK
jgi:NAD(P)-dependent dehydrogenase (short-subunit alcohol dehydrogenase family)